MLPGMNQMLPGMPKPRPIKEYEPTYPEEVVRYLGAIPAAVITSIFDIPIQAAMIVVLVTYIISAFIVLAFKLEKTFDLYHELSCLCKYPIASFLTYIVVYNIKLLL